MTALPVRVIIADDHPIVLDGLRRLFESEKDFRVVACCGDGIVALDAVHAHVCDVLVLDLGMPGKTGLEVLQTIAKEKLPCRVVLLTAALKDDEVLQALRLGALGVVLKESAPDALHECVRKVQQGEQWLDRDTMARALDRAMIREAASRESGRSLTRRELEIVQMVAQGRRNKAIADKLYISVGTVKIHLHNIYEKLGVDGRLELVLYAQAEGLV
jgi:DNA-binding NarL/FixJ family response regulator